MSAMRSHVDPQGSTKKFWDVDWVAVLWWGKKNYMKWGQLGWRPQGGGFGDGGRLW